MTTTVRLKIPRRRRATSITLPEAAPAEPKPSGAALALAQAYWFLELLEHGVVKNQAELAAQCGLSRMRVSQVMAMLDLPLETQARLLDEAWSSTTSARSAEKVRGTRNSVEAVGPVRR